MSQNPSPTEISRPLIFLLASAIAVIVANLYYAQPIVAMISRSLGLAPEAAGLVVTLTQAGYGIGVLFLVPLGDIIESRRLILAMIFVTIIGLLGLMFSTQLMPYFLAAFITGLGASTVQVIVPYAADFAPEEKRGEVVGSLMSGLMIGIMLSRPIASLMTDWFSWHAVFMTSAILMAILAIVLYFLLPERTPKNANLHYAHLLKSMLRLFVDTEVLRRRGIYQACLFGSFCLFWTATPLLLAGPEFHMSQSGIALFALVGVAGAVSAPFAGKAADRGWSFGATAFAMIASSLSFAFSHFLASGGENYRLALGVLVFAAVLLDAGITANLVLGQRAIFSLGADVRSRLNGLYIAMIFVGGASGSALGAWGFAKGGWKLASEVGFALPAAAFIYFLTELIPRRRNAHENSL